MIYNILLGVLSSMGKWITVALSCLMVFTNKYLFDDWQYLIFLGVLIIIDTIGGIVRRWKDRTISSSGFAKFFLKLIVYGIFLITIHVLTHFTVRGQVVPVFEWIDFFALSAIVVRESLSIFENIAAIDTKLVPNWLLRRLKEYQKDPKLP